MGRGHESSDPSAAWLSNQTDASFSAGYRTVFRGVTAEPVLRNRVQRVAGGVCEVYFHMLPGELCGLRESVFFSFLGVFGWFWRKKRRKKAKIGPKTPKNGKNGRETVWCWCGKRFGAEKRGVISAG